MTNIFIACAALVPVGCMVSRDQDATKPQQPTPQLKKQQDCAPSQQPKSDPFRDYYDDPRDILPKEMWKYYA